MKASLLGVTGGLATGKTTFARMLAAKISGEYFSADEAVHSLLARDPEVRAEILARIHPEAYLPDGSPDRRKLREIVFSSDNLRKAIEAILHPRVRALWRERARACLAANQPLVAEIPLLFEADAAGDFDAVIVVACSETVRDRRLEARGDTAMAKKMIASQWPLDTKVRLARHVIWNDGPPQGLAAQTDLLLSFLDVRTG